MAHFMRALESSHIKFFGLVVVVLNGKEIRRFSINSSRDSLYSPTESKSLIIGASGHFSGAHISLKNPIP
jgi:hypothetical protein